MTADRRLQVGGWAALLIAVLLPLEFVAVRILPVGLDGAVNVGVLTLSSTRLLATLVAVIGLDGWLRSIAPGSATRVLAVGVAGSALGIVLEVWTWFVLTVPGFAGAGFGNVLATWSAALAGILIGLWFFLGGAIVLNGGHGLARVGWPGMIGGGAMILAAVTVAMRFGTATGRGPDELSLRDWFHLIGLFVVLYLIRTWRYVVGGRLPAPGIL